MRSRLQQFYDSFYYGFESHYNAFFLRFSAWKKFLGVKFNKSFYANYKNTVVPYWEKFGVKPPLSMVKTIFTVSGGSLDPRYIPDNLWMRDIVPHFNDRRFSRVLADKNLNSAFLPEAKRPKTLFKSMSGQFCLDDFTPISREAALRLCQSEGRWVIKPTLNSFQGQNVRIFQGPLSPEAAEKLIARYETVDFIVQAAVVQHPVMNTFNASSINTLRVVTLIFQNKPHVLSTILRVGAPGSIVDNIGAGGFQFDVRADGSVSPIAYSSRKGRPVHTDRSAEETFRNAFIPNYAAICETAKTMAKKVPHLRLIAWDFAIDTEGDPVLLEFNTQSPGQNQETSGPSFGSMTEEVLTEVYGHRKRKS